jgi:hypothetical protein
MFDVNVKRCAGDLDCHDVHDVCHCVNTVTHLASQPAMCFLLTLVLAQRERPTENLATSLDRFLRLAGGGRGGALGRVTVTGTYRKQFFYL